MNESYDLDRYARGELEKRNIDLAEFSRQNVVKLLGNLAYSIDVGFTDPTTPEEFIEDFRRCVEKVRTENVGAEVLIKHFGGNPSPTPWGQGEPDDIDDFAFFTFIPESDDHMGRRAIKEYDRAAALRATEEWKLQEAVALVEKRTGKKVVLAPPNLGDLYTLLPSAGALAPSHQGRG